MTSELSKIFEIQKKFNEKLYSEKFGIDFNKIPEEKLNQIIKDTVLSCGKEVFEVLDEIKWKNHRVENTQENADNYLEECIDAFKFLINLVLLKGYTEEQFFDKFIQKSAVVDFRYEQEKQLKKLKESDENIVIIDIDGVLNNYPVNFINFVEENYKTRVLSLYNFSKTNPDLYRKAKTQFRLTGLEALSGVQNQKSINYLDYISNTYNVKIVLLTSRPYKKFNNLFSQTLKWLKTSNVKYDYLFFADDKVDFIECNFNSKNIKFIVDDQIENVNSLSRFYHNVFYFRNDLVNENKVLFNNIHTVDKIEQVFDFIKDERFLLDKK